MRLNVHSGRARALTIAAAAAAALAVAPAAAQAASVSVGGGTLSYATAADETNHVTVAPWGLALRVTETGTRGAKQSAIALTAGSGCSQLSSTSAACSSLVTAIGATLGNGDDFFDGSLVLRAETISGGAGNDTISTGTGADTLDGGAGADVMSGGGGLDSVTYAATMQPVTARLGGGAGNGSAGENDTIAADVEGLIGGGGGDTLTGDGAANLLDGGAGNDALDGGEGTDSLTGGTGDDTLTATDGSIDSLACGDGSDGGSADAADSVAADCEAVTRPVATGPAPVEPPVDPVDPGDGRLDGTTANASTNSVPPTIPEQSVAVSASGVATVQVVCPPDSGGCSGTVAIVVPLKATGASARAVASAAKSKTMRIGQARFKAAAGTKPTIRVRLTKRGRQRILRNVRSRGRIVVTTKSADGKTTVTSQSITFHERRRPPRKRRGRK